MPRWPRPISSRSPNILRKTALAAAARTIGKLQQAARDLAKFPAKFPLVGKRSGRQLRRRPWRSYAIYYVVGEQNVEIVRVLHAARDADRILFPED